MMGIKGDRMNHWNRTFVETTRGTFEVFVKGEGHPVCVTHHYSEFNESGDYYADVFTSTHKVFLVNLREAGNSEKANEPYQLTMIEVVFDLEAIRESLGYSTWTYAGHSTGGMIGLIYGVRYSNSLDALIITGAAAREYAYSSPECIYNKNHPYYDKMQYLIESLKKPDISSSQRKELSKERTRLSLFRPEKYDEYFSPNVHKKMSAVRMNFFAREVLTFDITRQLSNISTRTLILCGRHDVQCPLPYSQEIHEQILDSQFHIFDESNHYPFLEEKEFFKKVVHDFTII